MSPEALRCRCFSRASDVWAFGVLLWELYSGGALPYRDIDDVGLLETQLAAGHRLACPPNCPPAEYAVMQRCWAAKPSPTS